MSVTEENAAEYATAIYERYKGRIEKFLATLRDDFRNMGWQATDPMDMSADEYEWCILVSETGTPTGEGKDTFCIELEVVEAMEYDGVPGVSFGLDITWGQGYVVGGLQPYNFTPDVWAAMDDDDEIEHRFSLIEKSDFASIYNVCAEYRKPT